MYLQLFLSISVDPVGDRATEWKVVLQMTSFQQGILSKVGIVPCLLIELCDLRDHLYFKACKEKTRGFIVAIGMQILYNNIINMRGCSR